MYRDGVQVYQESQTFAQGQEQEQERGKWNWISDTLTIPYANHPWLRALMRLAEATEGGGQLKVYRVVNDTAAAFGMRLVQFSDGVSAREETF